MQESSLATALQGLLVLREVGSSEYYHRERLDDATDQVPRGGGVPGDEEASAPALGLFFLMEKH
jgi:hypothetical protein